MKILITGATSGIGYQLARVLLHLGHDVYAGCHRDEQLNKKTNETNLTFVKLDLLDKEDFKIVEEESFDVLVCHAGVGYGGAILENLDKLKANFDVNVLGTFSLIERYISACKKENRKGKVLITSSLAGYLPIPYLGSYTSSKASLSLLVRTLRYELFLESVPVQIKLIVLGAYKTGYNQMMLSGIEDEKTYQVMHSMFSLLEKKNLKTVVNKMVKAIHSDSRQFVYSVPFFQSFMAKIYKGLFF